MADTFSSAVALLSKRSPVDPVVCLRPHLIKARARRVVDAFPGDVLYAVKCNDAPEVLRALWAGGVRQFHFYTLNRAELSYAICHLLGVRPRGAAASAAA